MTNLLLSVGPAGDLDNHVQDGLLLVGVQRNVVEGRDWDAILLNKDAVVESVGSANVAGGVSGSHCGVWMLLRWWNGQVTSYLGDSKNGTARFGGVDAAAVSQRGEGRRARIPNE